VALVRGYVEGKPKKGKQMTLGDFAGKGKGKNGEVAVVGGTEPPCFPEKVFVGVGVPTPTKKGYNDEGRAVTLEYGKFSMVFAYVPNSGEKLVRLQPRLNDWEADMIAHLSALAKSKPVIYGGDLNVAHLDGDIWNPEAKHIPKSAGTSPEERAAFGRLLEEAGLEDCWRVMNGNDAKGAFTFWSQRAQGRPKNRGLRLDYFLATKGMVGEVGEEKKGTVRVVDCRHLEKETVGISDHCPVVIGVYVPE